jgi:ribosomal-protein-alanine N-acetyltransferase
MAIEESSFPTPWPRSSMVEELQRPRGALYLAAERDGVLVGYAGMWCFAGEAHIMNIAVDLECRRLGIGEALLLRLLERAVAMGATYAFLECRPSNRRALALYEKLGFRRYGRRPNYYRDTGEDALLLACEDLANGRLEGRWPEWERRHGTAVMGDEWRVTSGE